MKRITDNAVYVQKKDIAFFIEHNIEMPIYIMAPLLEEGPLHFDETDKYNFIKYTDEASMAFFEHAEWILDYDMANALTQDECLEMMAYLVNQLDELDDEKSKMTEEDKKEHPNAEDQYLLFNHLYSNYLDFFGYRNGTYDFEIPGGQKL